MYKIRNLRVKAFRGVRFEQTVDFEKSRKSLAVFGYNASGKSTITDAIEWFFTGQVRHLWAEDCKAEAIRNIHQDYDSEVEIRFDDDNLSSTRTLTASLKTEQSNTSKDFQEFLENASKERIVLRHADVANFVVSTKNKKREEIEKIIGYEQVRKFRDVIRGVRAKLESDSEYLTAVRLVEQNSAELLQLAGEIVTENSQVMKILNVMLQAHEVRTQIVDADTYKKAVEELKGLIGDPKRAEKKVGFQNLKKDAERVQNLFERFEIEKSEFEKSYSELVTDRDAIKRIRMESFLSAGFAIVDEDDKEGISACPFCLSDYDLDVLKAEVEERIQEISELSEKHKTASEKKAASCETLSEIQRQLLQIEQDYSEQVRDLPAFSQIDIIREELPSDLSLLEEKFTTLSKVDFSGKGFEGLWKLHEKLPHLIETADKEAQKLSFSETENKMIETLSRCKAIVNAYGQRTKNKRIVDSFRKQISTLSEVYDSFIEAQNKAVQAVLDAISQDVDRFYCALHPSATVDSVRLRILGEQGVEFEYSFHGKPSYPPKKYLSESYLNSLGIVLFLASAKIFNERCRFLVLDDIVTSFDQSLRRRLIRLLNEEFSDWQILLLTHEEFWFEIMKREFPTSQWMFKEVKFDSNNGACLDESPLTLEALISAKRKSHDVTNDLRKLLEQTLKEICLNVQAKVAFRYNDQNEHRMGDELLSALQGTVKKRKCTEVTDAAIFSNLKGSALVTNRGSHDSSDQINEGDIDVALEDINSLKELFMCESCNRYVCSRNLVPGEKKISCACGSKKLSWN